MRQLMGKEMNSGWRLPLPLPISTNRTLAISIPGLSPLTFLHLMVFVSGLLNQSVGCFFKHIPERVNIIHF